MTTFQTILTKFEFHIIQLFINVTLNVKIGNKICPNIQTNVEICQSDCLSALLFLLYLSHAVKPLSSQIEQTDYGKSFWSALDWMINIDEHKKNIDPKYADDISFLRSDESKTQGHVTQWLATSSRKPKLPVSSPDPNMEIQLCAKLSSLQQSPG